MKYPLYDTDDGSATGGTGGTPNPLVSQAADQVHSPVDTKTLEGLVKDLQGQVRALQSDKDKGVAKIGAEVKSLSDQIKRITQLQKRGMDEDEIVRQLEIDALLEEKRGKLVTDVPSASVGSQKQAASGSVNSKVIETLGLDANSPEVVRIIKDVDPNDQLIALITLARKPPTQPSTNLAQALSGGGGASVSATTESLQAEYQEMTKNAPLGERGVDARWNAKRAIREKAAQAKVPSPV